jgi:uncharacterized damage-inducible protein DinB
MSWIAPEIKRVDEPFVGDERAILEGLLEWHRATLLHQCAGLTGEQLARWAVPPSNLSLLGLVRHMAEVERQWFRRRFGGADLPELYPGADADFEQADPAGAADDYATLLAEQEAARAAVADLALDAIFEHPKLGAMSLRWCYAHMLEEYARHNGHADFLRERIDGRTGG